MDLIQTHYLNNLWKMLVACVLLNRTRRVQVDRVITVLFERWPSAEAMRFACKSELSRVLQPLGFYNRRASTLIKLSQSYVDYKPTDESAVANLPGVGKYALDSYRIFFLNQLNIQVEDKELKKYLEWRCSC